MSSHAKTFAALGLACATAGAVVGLICAVIVSVHDMARVWTLLASVALFVMAIGVVAIVYVFSPEEERLSADEVSAILDADDDGEDAADLGRGVAGF